MNLYDKFAVNALIPLLDWWRQDAGAKYASEAKRILALPPDSFRDFQLKRIREVCTHAYNHTSFYQRRFDSIGISNFDNLSFEDFEAIPKLTKQDIRDHGDELVSNQFPKPSMRKTATGGTTASPTTVFLDWPSYGRRWAATHEFDRRIGNRRGQKIAFLWGAPQDFPTKMPWKERLVSRFITRNRYYTSSPLDHSKMEKYYRDMQKWKPAFLQGYSTPMAIFAEFLLSENLNLNIPNISVTAEPLSPEQSELIERAFGKKPYCWYGARESGRIATGCDAYDGMHINTYGIYVEVESSAEYSDHSFGPLLLTDLWNLGMPLIKYEIGDLGSLDVSPCSCGSQLPKISKVIGRITDVFINRKGQKIPGVSFTNRIIKDNTIAKEMQFIQIEVGKFDVKVVPGENWDDESSERLIRQKLDEFMHEPTEASISKVQMIPREPSGKVRFCKSLLPTHSQ